MNLSSNNITSLLKSIINFVSKSLPFPSPVIFAIAMLFPNMLNIYYTLLVLLLSNMIFC